MGVPESDATEQLNTFTFTKEKAFPKREKKRGGGKNPLKKVVFPEPTNEVWPQVIALFLGSSSLLVKCDKCSTLQIVLRVKEDRVNESPL